MTTRVASLGPGTYSDPAQVGLQLLVRRTRRGFSRTWLLRFKFRGQATRILIGHFPATSLERARALAREYRERASQGIDPRRSRPRRIALAAHAPSPVSSVDADSPHSIESLMREFLDRHVRPNSRRPEYVAHILKRNVAPVWQGRDARSIKPREVIDLLDEIVERGSPVMANRTASVLSQLFRFGIHRAIVETSPVQLLMRPGGKERPRQRALTDDELRQFLRDPRVACRYARLASVILILLLTGQRRGELANAKWTNVDLKARTWTIPPENSKTGRGHVVPLSGWAVAEFRVLKAHARRSRWLLPAEDPTQPLDPKLLSRSLARSLGRFRKVGIADFTLHDLRRTCRTGLARLRVEPHIAERVLNHAQERIAGTYDVHDYLDEKRVALDRWAEHLSGLIPTAAASE
ncbi:MAG TPA: tyrosine-type recombinase/integrase [Burkholderiaceae bacterium]|nr:tyrosine-type recombinase/integrase [Burkholderiaceae bacterium]